MIHVDAIPPDEILSIREVFAFNDTEAKMLAVFKYNAGRRLSLDAIWELTGRMPPVIIGSIRTRVRRIRAQLGDNSIATIQGYGYKMPVEALTGNEVAAPEITPTSETYGALKKRHALELRAMFTALNKKNYSMSQTANQLQMTRVQVRHVVKALGLKWRKFPKKEAATHAEILAKSAVGRLTPAQKLDYDTLKSHGFTKAEALLSILKPKEKA